MQDDKVKGIAGRLPWECLSPFDFKVGDIRAGFDHDHEPALFIDAVLDENAPDLPPETMVDAYYGLSQQLLAGGEERFPCLFARFFWGESRGDPQIEKRGRT